MCRGVARALRLDLLFGQSIENALHRRAMRSDLAALEIGLGEFQLAQRILGEFVQDVRVSWLVAASSALCTYVSSPRTAARAGRLAWLRGLR